MKLNHLFSILLIFTLTGVNLAQASDVNQGRAIYQRHCAACHGANGKASMAGAADFNRGQGLMQSDQALLKRIQRGDKACPAYFGILDKQQTLDVIAFIRTLF